MTSSSTPNHIPVMPNEVLALMDLKPRGKYVDGTCGLGGHAEMILSSLSKKGFLLGLDIDKDAIKICKKRLDNFSSNFHIEKKSYSELSSVLHIVFLTFICLNTSSSSSSVVRLISIGLSLISGYNVLATFSITV